MTKDNVLSFHIAEIFWMCPRQYYKKFVEEGGHEFRSFSTMSTMLAGRILMYGINHTREEVETEFMKESGKTSIGKRERKRLARIYNRCEQIRVWIAGMEKWGYTCHVSQTRSKPATWMGRAVTLRSEADIVCYNEEFDDLVIVEIKATDNAVYNARKNWQLEWLRRFMRYDDGEHPHREPDEMLWMLFDGWGTKKNPHPTDDMIVIEEHSWKKVSDFDTRLIPCVNKLVNTPNDPSLYPPDPGTGDNMYKRCRTCFCRHDCPACSDQDL